MKVRISGKPGMYQVTDVETGKAVSRVVSADIHIHASDPSTVDLVVISLEQPRYIDHVAKELITAELESVDIFADVDAEPKDDNGAILLQPILHGVDLDAHGELGFCDPSDSPMLSIGAQKVQKEQLRSEGTETAISFKQGEPIKFKMEAYTSKAFSNWWDAANLAEDNDELAKFREENQDRIDKMFADMAKRTDQWILGQLTKTDESASDFYKFPPAKEKLVFKDEFFPSPSASQPVRHKHVVDVGDIEKIEDYLKKYREDNRKTKAGMSNPQLVFAPETKWGAIPSLEEFTNARLGEPYTAKKSEEDKTLEDSIDKMVDTIQKDEKRRTLTATGWHDQLARLCDQLSKGAVVFVHSEDQKNAAQEVAKRLRRKDLVFIIPEDEPKSKIEEV